MAQKKKNKKNETLDISFEQAIEDLTGIVNKIETGQVSLAESLEQYEKGMARIKHCRGILLDAEKRIKKRLMRMMPTRTKQKTMSCFDTISH